MRKSGKSNLINIISCLLLIGTIIVIIAGVRKSESEIKRIVQVSANKIQSPIEQEQIKPTNSPSIDNQVKLQQTEVAITNPYEKIKNKKDVSVLVIGDNIAQSDGVDLQQKWHTLLGNSISSQYGSKTTFKLLTSNKQGVAKSLDDYSKAEAGNKYDFIILCLGEYDINSLPLDQFKKIYEELIRKIKQGNENCEVITIIQSSVQINKTYPTAIKELSDYYELTLLDEREKFKQSNIAYNKLVSQDEIIPSKEGYNLYAVSLMESIKVNIEKGKKIKALEKVQLHKN